MEYIEQKMQQQMEAAEAEHDDLCERLAPPHDWQNPKWETENRVHNWRNYANEDLKEEWQSMSGRQRLIVAAALDEIADREEWD
jgi:hypothetical protein